MRASGQLHADHRIQDGFPFRAVLAECRALRATVLRLYEESGATDLSEIRQFNEAIDESLAEPMDRFAQQTDLFRDQFIGVLSHDLRTPLGAVATGAANGQRSDHETQRFNVSRTACDAWQRGPAPIAVPLAEHEGHVPPMLDRPADGAAAPHSASNER